ncbi:MAG: leucine-rich repeat protein [Treponema sp.]|nr:leucine-rich repeat protein [Treponema sp.]
MGANTLYATSITEIIIPETVTSIGAYAFAHTNLSSLVIPRNVKK